jgi:hypothetical protein
VPTLAIAEVALQRRNGAHRQRHAPILLTLGCPQDNQTPIEIDILHAQR